MAESFFATLKRELIYRGSWPDKNELRMESFEFIEVFYNRRRRHSTLGMLSPVDYENSTLSEPASHFAASRRIHIERMTITAPTETVTA